MMKSRFLTILVLLFGSLFLFPAHAEQKEIFSDYEVHYILLPTTFLKADIADKYNLRRSKDRALVNVSVLDLQGTPVKAEVRGSSENLLGQRQNLTFDEVIEGEAIYYLALLRYADEEFQRVALNVVLPDGELAEIKFQQKMYWDR
ncbi:MAG: DUF4426 domain-containing protein [Pseudomonadaceae bacterium]|nr:DUF4426 domain-containing protein [Pseudomonadaceae bacterium]